MDIDKYRFLSDRGSHSQAYLMPIVLALLEKHAPRKQLFEIGFGNGANAEHLHKQGFCVSGVEPSSEGVKIAKKRGLALHQGSTDDDLAARFGQFPVILSLEVIEHVYSPKLYAHRINELLEPGGVAIISTPYHGYAKNLALAVSGKLDAHFTALWEGGHIKFFSRRTLSTLFAREAMDEIDFCRVGRIPSLAKSMISVFRKPA